MHPGWLARVHKAADVDESFTQWHAAESPDVVPDSQESQDLSDSVSQAAARVWWARNLIHHTQSLDFKIPEEPPLPVRVLSACTGSFAEGACFKDCLQGLVLTGHGIEANHISSCTSVAEDQQCIPRSTVYTPTPYITYIEA